MRRSFILLTLFALVALAGCGRSSARKAAATATRASLWTAEAERVLVVTATPLPPATATVILPDLMKTPRSVAGVRPDTPTATHLPSATPTNEPTETPTKIPIATPTPEPAQAIITGDLVNVRAGPGVSYGIVGIVAVGDTLDVSGRTDDDPAWYRVCCVNQGKTGWIRGDLLDPNASAQAVEVVDDASLPPAPPAPTTAPAASRPQPAPGTTFSSTPLPLPAGSVPAVNPFTGLPGGNLARRPVFVCINNDVEARPQYGLSQADIVYEYVMEGRAITRYSALFWSQDAARIGPVRSARLINVEATSLYQAALLCSGASSGVRYILKHQVNFPYLDVDLDDPGNNVYSMSIGTDYRTRLQTSSPLLERFINDWGVNRIPNTRGLLFGDYGGGAPASRVDIPYPSLARTAWVWNGGQWARLGRDDTAYIDAGTGQQITADNVVIQWAQHLPTDIVEDSLGTTSIRIELLGSGQVKILRDGKVIDGTWRADDPNQPPQFFDAGGAPIPLHPGRTWFQIVEPRYQVTVQ